MGLFGRGKDDRDELACAQCGRTLLAGEWTQRIIDGDGEESLVCSLCSQRQALDEGQPLVVSGGSVNATRLKESRTDSDSFWRALKEKDAEIERLQAQVARGEAERQELVARLAQMQRQLNGEAPYDGDFAAPVLDEPPADLAPDATGPHPYDVLGTPTGEPTTAHPYAALEPETIEQSDLGATMPGDQQAFIDQPVGDIDATMPGEPIVSEPPAPSAAQAAPIMQSGAFAGASDAGASDAAGAPDDAGAGAPNDVGEEPLPEPIVAEGDTAALTLLQRGVDLLNVSPVPKKISETNEHLGMPSVHVGFDNDRLVVTFLWTMGWYRYEVAIEGAGTVRLGDRGYEERTDLTPNAGVRADGTVQLAPARITRGTVRPEGAAAAEPPAAGSSAPRAPLPADPQDQPAPAVNRGDIISKSLMGQRTDDEEVSWDKQQSRDFNWDR